MPARSKYTQASLGIPQHMLTPFYGHTRAPTQSGLMTLGKIATLVRTGRGQGHLSRYEPWLRVERRDMSPVSPMGHLPSPEFGHTHHYRSRLERGALLILKWLRAYDAREQFPVWPWDHRHPLYGLPGHDTAPTVTGVAEYAKECGVPMRVSVTRTIPTIDILVTWRSSNGAFELTAYDCKPAGCMEGPKAWSSLERLELLRRYAQEIHAGHHIVNEFCSHKQLLENLDALRPCMSRHEQQTAQATRNYQALIENCHRWAYDQPLDRVIERFARRSGMDLLSANRMVNIALWHQDLDHDLSLPREPWLPLVAGGRILRDRLTAQWKGVAA